MEKVASHINEMQKIYEDYGAVFDQLVADQSGTEKEVRVLGCAIPASNSRLGRKSGESTLKIVYVDIILQQCSCELLLITITLIIITLEGGREHFLNSLGCYWLFHIKVLHFEFLKVKNNPI